MTDFLDKGFWTPQTFMLRSLEEWVQTCTSNPVDALSVDANPQLDAMFVQKWPNLHIERALYPDVDACDLGRYPDAAFDLVYSHQVLEHVPKPWIAAREMTRVLRPGGIGIHTTCAFNPRHGQPHFNDYYRFLKEGLVELFGEVQVLQSGEWGNRQAILYNTAFDDGHGALGGRRFHEAVGSRNDGLYPWVTWIICQKAPHDAVPSRPTGGAASTRNVLQGGSDGHGGQSVVEEDSHGIKFLLRDFERPIRDLLVNRTCDDAVFAAFAMLLQPGDVFFDVGAHVGRYSVYPSRIVGPSGVIHAFEPVEDNYWQLQATAALNRCENIVPNKTALCDRTGNAEINLFDEAYSSWSSLGQPEMVAPDGRLLKPHRKQGVICDTIDHYCVKHKIPRVHFLKIDVEGFELHVLKGAAGMLGHKSIDYICFEISMNPLTAAAVRPEDILALLRGHGYEVYALQGPPYAFTGPVKDLSCYHDNFYASCRDMTKMTIEQSDRHV